MERFCGEVDACFAKAYLGTDLDKNVEEAYSRHYVWNQSQEKKNQIIADL
jgi:hypothetical protein